MAGRLNVAVTRARSKLILVGSRRLLDVTPAENETFESADRLRQFIDQCAPASTRAVRGPDGRAYRVEVRCRGPRFCSARRGGRVREMNLDSLDAGG
jgi:hypothetical protein